MTTETCPRCGKPADHITYWGIKIYGCPCVGPHTMWRALINEKYVELAALVRESGIRYHDNHDPGDEDRD